MSLKGKLYKHHTYFITLAIFLLMFTLMLTTACEKDGSDSDTESDTENVEEEIPAEKPVIYLYPEVETAVHVELDFLGDLMTTYPEYNGGWDVIASPEGRLVETTSNQEYSYLFWDGTSDYEWKIEKGFVVKGEDTAEFLREKLTLLGLEPREYNEFIVYWLPRMAHNKYNLIYFPDKEYTDQATLNITPEPDSLIRVFMVFKPLEKEIQIEEQKLLSKKRNGFAVIEWGGTELK